MNKQRNNKMDSDGNECYEGGNLQWAPGWPTEVRGRREGGGEMEKMTWNKTRGEGQS